MHLSCSKNCHEKIDQRYCRGSSNKVENPEQSPFKNSCGGRNSQPISHLNSKQIFVYSQHLGIHSVFNFRMCFEIIRLSARNQFSTWRQIFSHCDLHSTRPLVVFIMCHGNVYSLRTSLDPVQIPLHDSDRSSAAKAFFFRDARSQMLFSSRRARPVSVQ